MKIKIEIDLPETCGKCPFYSETPYQCHSETGHQANCSKGYMSNRDMRDVSYRERKFEACKLSEVNK